MQAVIAATVFAVLALLITPLALISSAVIMLTVLRQGWREGALVLVSALLAIAVLAAHADGHQVESERDEVEAISRGLAALGRAEDMELFVKAFKDPDYRVRAAAVAGLAATGEPGAASSGEAVTVPSEQVRLTLTGSVLSSL